MKLKLFDFQEQVLATLRNRVLVARSYAASPNATPQAIVFSAPTGSGKTIIMGALFEDILFGEADFPAQPDAVILWVSDMPELNEQTRLKIEGKSDRIRTGRLVTIDAGFDAERLEGGYIYFINTQKLGQDKLLTRQGDGRTWPIWTTLSNTARESPDRFYVVIDEAHRGMTSPKQAKEARTLMQRFLLGHQESGLIPMPLVIGVSATPKRFMDLLEKAKDTTIHKAEVRADEVRESGLLKDRILIHHPDAPTTAEMALLAEAARRWAGMRSAWEAYCRGEGERVVWPILVVQVANATAAAVTQTNLDDALDTIEDAIGRPLREGEVAHALHECGDLDVGGRRVRRVEASRIEEDKNIGLVLFKTSLSTGWDCPRAEVMMSFRAAQDNTYIAQLLGRKYERLRLATAKPVAIPWALPDSISFRRAKGATPYAKHLYLEEDGQFRADLGTWEVEVLQAELANPQVVGWLRNQDRKPWSLEIPYQHGGEVRPLFPDLVLVRQVAGEAGYRVDILEPHDPSLGDNVGKAVGLARFAEQHGHLFDRIQLIRKLPSPAGGEAYFRLEINKQAVQKKLLEVTTGPQLDALFESDVVIGA